MIGKKGILRFFYKVTMVCYKKLHLWRIPIPGRDKVQADLNRMHPGENPQEALVREIREELDTDIRVGELFCVREFDYPDFHLVLHCYLCALPDGAEPALLEHKAAKWLDAQGLTTLQWLPADEEIIQALLRLG